MTFATASPDVLFSSAANAKVDGVKKLSLSAKGVAAGKKILREDPRQQKVLESELRKRQYKDPQAEETRSLMLSKLLKKVTHFSPRSSLISL